MSNQKFEDFLNRQIAESRSTTIDWSLELGEWKNALDSFYQKVESFLESYIREGRIRISYSKIIIEEQDVGEYEVREATVSLGSNDLKLIPVGTNLIGAKGRVDLIGPYGRIKFVYVNATSATPKISSRVWVKGDEPPHSERIEENSEEMDWEWKIATDPPQIRYFPLNQGSFLDALMAVSSE